MGISYQICQDVGLQQNSVARAHCQACLRTVGGVPKNEDASSGALFKGLKSARKGDVPVFVLHGQVKVAEDCDGNGSAMGIDVSYMAKHYRILLRMKKQAWYATKISALPPMLYFNTVSRQVATQIGRTQLLTNTLADQISTSSDGGDDAGDGGESPYANHPSNYANIPV